MPQADVFLSKQRGSPSTGIRPTTCSSPAVPSKRLIYGQDQRVAEWVAARSDTGNLWDGKFIAIGLEENGELIAGLGFTDYLPGGSIAGHICAIPGKRWLTRPFLRILFIYPFVQLKVQRFNAMIPAKNLAVKKFVADLGFTFEHRMPRMLADDDVLIYRMFREDCRWLEI
jgi:RimJ/RimL family protein N-acetyltransferase